MPSSVPVGRTELGSAFLCADLELQQEPRKENAAYIATWLEVLGASIERNSPVVRRQFHAQTRSGSNPISSMPRKLDLSRRTDRLASCQCLLLRFPADSLN